MIAFLSKEDLKKEEEHYLLPCMSSASCRAVLL